MVKSYATSQNKLASTARSAAKAPSKTDTTDADAARSAFTGAALGMSWQLAVVVIVGIFGGYKLDQATGMSPVWTLVGLAASLAASILIIRRALNLVNNFTVNKADHEERDA